MARSWVKLDCHWYEDPDIEAATEEAGPVVLALFPVLLSMAKVQNDGGRVEFTWRSLGHSVFAQNGDAVHGIRALVSAGVLTCPEESERGGVLAFDPTTWRRWNDVVRKAEKRERETA